MGQTILLKSEVARSITDKLGIPEVHFSTGSTEPKELFLAVADSLGINVNSASTKPGLAKSIVQSSGGTWLPQFESSGSTVTLEGLLAVHSAVEFFLANRP
jgi:hypothetical protein